jgi:hypothetical protein
MGEQRYSSTVLDLGIKWRWSASRPSRFMPGENPLEAGWAPELVSTLWSRDKFLALPGNIHIIFVYII